MRKIFFVVFFSIASFCFADVRNYICIVRPNYNGDISNAISATADSLSSMGYKDLAEAVQARIKKDASFGSGFICILNDKSYCITNYHVVAYADTVSLEIQSSTGDKSRKIESCKVVAYDEDRDIALVEIPAKEKIIKGLSFYSGSVRDGIEVWSAGYPGLGEKPLWQLGKGNMSNTRVTLDELAPNKKTFFFQHSAPIDAGNSGGPLLVASKNSAIGYEVIGVNTATAIRRQNTNFAIPASSVTDFLKTALSDFTEAKKDGRFDEVKAAFIKLSSYENTASDETATKKQTLNRIQSLALLIGSRNAIDYGVDTLRNTLLQAPSYICDTLMEKLVYVHPIDAVKFSLAYRLEKDLNDYKTFAHANTTEEKHNEKKVVFKNQADDTLYTQWIFINNKWYLDNFSVNAVLSDKKVPEKSTKKHTSSESSFGIAIVKPYKSHIFVEYNGLLTKTGISSGVNIGYAYNFTYIDLGVFLTIQQNRFPDFYTPDSFFQKIAVGSLLFLEPCVPISFTDVFTLVPYARLGLGAAIGNYIYDGNTIQKLNGFELGVFTGLRFVFTLENGRKITTDAAYSGRFILGSKKENVKNVYLNGFAVGIGYAF